MTGKAKPKLAVDWEINGTMVVRAVDIYGTVYRLKTPLKLVFHQVMQLGLADKNGGQTIIAEGYQLNNKVLTISGSDWDAVMEDLEKAIEELGDYGYKLECEDDTKGR